MTTRYLMAEDRATYMREQLLEDIDGTEAGKDISASTLKVYFRLYQETGAGDLILDVLCTKVSTGSTGIVEVTATPLADYPRAVCRFVLVDEAVGSQPTPSTYREYVWLEWVEEVLASPQPAP